MVELEAPRIPPPNGGGDSGTRIPLPMAVGDPGVPTPLSMICLEDGFAALDSTTTLPYSGQYDLGSEETIYTNGSDQAYGTHC